MQTHLFRLQFRLHPQLFLMQRAEFVDLLLVFAAHLEFSLSRCLLFLGELSAVSAPLHVPSASGAFYSPYAAAS